MKTWVNLSEIGNRKPTFSSISFQSQIIVFDTLYMLSADTECLILLLITWIHSNERKDLKLKQNNNHQDLDPIQFSSFTASLSSQNLKMLAF